MISATITGVDIVIDNLESVGVDLREAAYYAIIEVLQHAFKSCQDTISEADHSLAALALMKHPYGFEHPQQIHDPDVLVHVQTGRYRDALRAIPPVASGGSILEGRIDMSGDSEMQTLDRWIQEGTSKMRARPWMQYIVDTFGEDFAALIEARILEAAQELAA